MSDQTPTPRERTITFVFTFKDYENAPEEFKQYIDTMKNNKELNGVYCSTIFEGNAVKEMEALEEEFVC